MKKLFVSFVIGALLMSCSNPNGKSWNEYGLKGRVKTCKHTGSQVNYVNGEYVRTGNVRDNIYEFNSDGLIVKFCMINSSELLKKLSFSIHYKYDENGVLLETENFSYDGTFSSKTLYKYNGVLLMETNSYDDFNYKFKQETFSYDGNGLLLSQHLYRNSSLKEYSKYSYRNGSLFLKKVYDAKYNTLRYASRYEDGKEVIRESTAGENMHISYNENDLPSFIKNGKFYMDLFNMSSDDIVEVVGFSDAFYEYKYDSHGNWIEKVEFVGEGKIPMRLEQRVITYY
ncbi:MAG: hypothetical protein IJX29_03955 [Bacteroides sp.]|nr:hypothetical protein [Bacteroides sp.]